MSLVEKLTGKLVAQSRSVGAPGPGSTPAQVGEGKTEVVLKGNWRLGNKVDWE